MRVCVCVCVLVVIRYLVGCKIDIWEGGAEQSYSKLVT
jgi:hypothetical protein